MATTPEMDVTVTDPQKQGDGMGAYISYKVNTTTSLPEYGASSFHVVKRFSDFLWLRNVLVEACPGTVVPPVPEKAVVGRFNADFIQSRQRALQNFVRRITRSPVLRTNKHTLKFLTATEPEWAAHKAAVKAAAPKTGFLSWVSSKGSSFMSSFGSSSGSKSAEDLSFEEISNYVTELGPLLQAVLNHTQMLIRRRKELGMGLYEFGLAFSMLGQSEADALGSALGRFGSVADKLSVFTNTHAEGERLFFEEQIRDYLRVVSAVKEALAQRDTRNAEYKAALSAVEQHRATVMKLKGLMGKDAARAKAEDDLRQAQAAVETARERYDTVARSVLDEMERFKVEKFEDFRLIILDYVNLQIAYSKKLEQAWSALIAELNTARDEEIARNPGVVATPVGDDDEFGLPASSAAPAGSAPPAVSTPGPTAGAGAGAGAGADAPSATPAAAPAAAPIPSTTPSAPSDVASEGGSAAPAASAAVPAAEAAPAPAAPLATSQDDIGAMFGEPTAPQTEELL